MIQAQELRLDNITDKGLVRGIRYHNGSMGCDILENKFDSHFKWFDLSQLNPILITEEWLVKLGFRCINNGYYILEDEHENHLFGFERTAKGLQVDHYYFGYHLEPGRMDYIHQLQNLIYAYSGVELKTK